MLLLKRTITKLFVLLFASAIVFSGCEDLFGDDPNTPVEIPDELFLHALIEQGVDYNGDSVISYAEAEIVTMLDVQSYDPDPSLWGHNSNWVFGRIKDITGIEAFVNIDTLICARNEISNINVSKNSKLEYLDCFGNGLSALDVSNNKNLKYLSCGFNNLTDLDISKNTALTHFYCIAGGLNNIDFTQNIKLTVISVSNIPESSMFSGGWNNQLTSLDVSNNTALTKLYCDRNQLTDLDVSNNTALTKLHCGHNQLTTLDVSKNAYLTDLYIDKMPNLTQVCVWTMPFPPEDVHVHKDDSPNVYFTTDCSK